MVTVNVVKLQDKTKYTMRNMPVGAYGVVVESPHSQYIGTLVVKTKNKKIVDVKNPVIEWDEDAYANVVKLVKTMDITVTLE